MGIRGNRVAVDVPAVGGSCSDSFDCLDDFGVYRFRAHFLDCGQLGAVQSVAVHSYSNTALTRAPFWVGTLLLFSALVVYYFTVIRIDYRKTTLLDPRPIDSVEYFAQANSLLKHGWPSIQIGYDKLPSRFPFGYPVLMLPWLKMLPEADSILAPFRTNQTLGFLFLLGVFAFYLYLTMPFTGGCAVLLLATLPGFVTFCRSSLSEITASALVVLAFMFAYLGLQQQCRWKIYLSAAFLGLLLNVRIQSLFFAPLLLGMILFPTRDTPPRRVFHSIAMTIIFLMTASPVLLLNTMEFHSPLKTGYDLWVPYWVENHRLFSVRYLPTNITYLWREITLRPNPYSVANVFGTGTVFVPAFVLLVCAGLPFIRMSRFVVCSFLAGLSFFVATALFRFADGRLFLPLLILLIPIAVLPVRWAARNLFSLKRIIAASGVFVLFAAACLGYPSRSGYNTIKTDRSQLWDALHFVSPLPYSPHFLAQRRLLETFGRQPGVVLSDISPVYLNTLLPEPFVAAPIDEKHSYQFSKIWRYDRSHAVALARRGLDRLHAVYALFASQKEMREKRTRLPELDGYEWIPAETSAPDAVILKLKPNNG